MNGGRSECIGAGAIGFRQELGNVCFGGDPERKSRAMNMVAQMDKEGFGACTNTGACEAVCPKGISIENIARLNREYILGAATAE